MDNTRQMYPEEDDTNFYFESDHLALKGNKDYTSFLKTIVILEAQRSQAIEDLDKLAICRSEAIKDPISFVAKLQNGNVDEFPGPQTIAEIPFVDWSQYNVATPDMKLRPQTRQGNITTRSNVKVEFEDSKILVRGRAFDESKPETFNQLWTFEEQKRLEELLVEYPPEEVEMRRWTKIANALGNRTPKQVSSRVQKYFIKLLRAGLPIPGRGPKVKLDTRRNLAFRNQRQSQQFYKKSTFFPHQEISCGIDDPKDQAVRDEIGEGTGNGSEDDNPEIRQIELLRQVKDEKETVSSVPFEHVGYKCFVCEEEPLKGTRWHCTKCPDEVDMCADCAVAQLEAENPVHDPMHALTPIRPPNYIRSYDFDYLPQVFNSNSYNYLDPNFCPE
ncbi:ZZ-type zinc finger-containing protein 3 [Leptopilina heterotoma]|uniref:ZZ-type zinc finger-containing protein 3 n=1 Tax=Leptopilina heterotoma TaxID=63436 RepID=UPI001CA96B5C|nr:ZZ-type zinc finger-containing protein 3 [Leptopilina heterotoma]XP_043462950.1 ZZ-type zinc finger-containing protein 3 [Leptopilina heterotoma]XP_043462951.1 ZZ-type zinc finger-containing protein 3 [Leptopilina heterotoma]